MGDIFMPNNLIWQMQQCVLILILITHFHTGNVYCGTVPNFNSFVSDPNDDGLKDARDEDGKIVISYSTLRSVLSPKLKQMSARYKIVCGCECCISDQSIH